MSATLGLRERLVQTLREKAALRDERVAEAFRRVPREVFVPGVPLDEVYADRAIVTKRADGIGISSSSQPAIMAIMLQQLELFPGARVLEIGAGTGYNAALMRELVGDAGRVVTLDIDDEMARWARERLDVAGYADVEVVCADGADGWPPGAPFDRVILTVGAAEIAPAWVEQLRPRGVLVLPLLVRAAQISVAFEKQPDGALQSRSVEPCGFMRIRGRLQDPLRLLRLTPHIVVGTTVDLPLDELRRLLGEAPRREAWDGTPWEGFLFFAGLWGLTTFLLQSEDGSVPELKDGAIALYENRDEPSLAVVSLVPDGGDAHELRAYGGHAARERLVAVHERWVTEGRRGVRELRIEAVPIEEGGASSRPGEVDIQGWRLWATIVS